MEKHRAIIVGAGRIGAGYNFGPWPYIYDHASTYVALRDRVELVGFVEPDDTRAAAACLKFPNTWAARTLDQAFRSDLKIDIVSICTPPEQREEIVWQCAQRGIKGIWCEKPLGLNPSLEIKGPLIQVNYIRRFDRRHQEVAKWAYTGSPILKVFGKKDIHTVCHFTDLARFWGISKRRLIYIEKPGDCYYELWARQAVPSILGSFGTSWTAEPFAEGGIEGGFMEAALGNLIDAMEGNAELISPAHSAMESEKWANEILEKHA